MKPYVEAILAEEQAGFRPGRSTVEQVFALKLLITPYSAPHWKERWEGLRSVHRLT